MTLLKLLFVLLILLPIAFFMMYILDNLLKDAKRAKSNTIDIHDAQDAKRRARNKKKREALLRSVKESAKRREEQPAEKKPAKKKKWRTAKNGREPQRAKRSSAPQDRPSQSGSAGRSRPSAPPVSPPLQDNSRAYIEEYKRRREELENRSRQAGKRNTLDEFDLMYGTGEQKNRKKSYTKTKSKTAAKRKRKK